MEQSTTTEDGEGPLMRTRIERLRKANDDQGKPMMTKEMNCNERFYDTQNSE